MNITERILPIITIALLFVNGLLIYQNLSLKAQIEAFSPKGIKKGNKIFAFQAKDLNGDITKIDFDGNNTKRVLLYFHPTCGWCKKQMPYWKELVSNADSSKFKISAITAEENIDDVKDYLANYDANSWETFLITKEDASKAELTGTPVTIVLDNLGNVEKVWVGMWRDKEVQEATDYFSIDFNKIKTEINAKTQIK